MSCNCEQQHSSEENKDTIARRNFLTKITVAVGGFVATILAIPLVSAMLDPVVRKKKKVWRRVGNFSDFKVGENKLVTFEDESPYKWSRKIAKTAAYVRKQENGELLVLSVNCAHLGCPVRWVEKSELFLCPCHGGVYYKNGDRAAGPPPRGLHKYPVRIVDNQVEIETEPLPITNLT